ncbi:MAG: ATP-dependent helicase, partial [Anaeromyxobacteraceae bacterium]|nr:ATP-dependent helicase [Anaeromyxobacteraceae bacterium]
MACLPLGSRSYEAGRPGASVPRAAGGGHGGPVAGASRQAAAVAGPSRACARRAAVSPAR